jgi:hypothetical protein
MNRSVSAHTSGCRGVGWFRTRDGAAAGTEKVLTKGARRTKPRVLRAIRPAEIDDILRKMSARAAAAADDEGGDSDG